MSAITPPQSRIWWKQPLDRVEGTWIVIAFAWCLVMFFMMPYWHVVGKQNLANEAYRTTPERFQAKAQEMVDKYKVREETEQKIPVVAPPPGSDVYLVARLWQWWPMIELEEGKSYRDYLNPESVKVVRGYVEPAAAALAPEAGVQFERLGFFTTDRRDHRADAPVFNRTVTLRDTWVAK